MPNGKYTPTISELIAQLQELRLKHGDLHCYYHTRNSFAGGSSLYGFNPVKYVAPQTLESWPIGLNSEGMIVISSGAETYPIVARNNLKLAEPVETWTQEHPIKGIAVRVALLADADEQPH